MVGESGEWISAAEAFKLVSAISDYSGQASRAICSRAHAGLIDTWATRLVIDRESRDNVLIPSGFWWADGGAALKQNWASGDFETWIAKKQHLRAFGVLFSRQGIEALVHPAKSSRSAPHDPSARHGGRPAAAWWDDLWIEICRQLWTGTLQPKNQADIEAAMMAWALKHGHNPGESTIRPRARKLWAALQKEDEN
jgi:hypothetical protein